MSETAGDKTEAPTQKRRDDAAKRGERPQSREIGPAFVMLGGAGYFAVAGASLVNACKRALGEGLALEPGTLDAFDPARAALRLAQAVAPPLGLLFAVTCVAAIASGTILGGGALRLSQLAPKPSRMDPLAGLARIFGAHGLTELGKALLKLVVVGAVAFVSVKLVVTDLAPLTRADPAAAIAALGARAAHLFLALTFGLMLVAGVDAPFALMRHLAKLRMTKQELKDEHKEAEGSPDVKAQQRRRMRETRRGTAATAVAGAHVVLTNPNRFAVALRYRRAEDRAPVPVAKGRGAVAAAIRAAAAEHALPVLEYPELARALYFTGRRDAEIDPDLYAAVAAILAFVFNLGRPGARAAAPNVDVPPSARFDEHGRRIG